MRNNTKLLFISYTAIMAAIMLSAQVLLSSLPNIELVSFLVIIYTILDKRLARASIAVFVALQGAMYGFHIWWINYLYIWYILHFAVIAAEKWLSPLFAALISGAFGIAFGTLCSLPYLFIAGPSGMLAYIISGIPFDIAHCIGNFVLCLILFAPMKSLADRLGKKIPQKKKHNPDKPCTPVEY